MGISQRPSSNGNDFVINPDAVISRLSIQIASLVSQLAMKDAALEDALERLAKYEQPQAGNFQKVSSMAEASDGKSERS